MIIKKITGTNYSYTEAELDKAVSEWGCNCGPGALATMLGVKPDDVRAHIPGFDQKRYTNPTMMAAALRSLGVEFHECRHPTNALCRIQWGGKWTAPGVPPRVAYRYTHWIGVLTCTTGTWVFDVNSGWTREEDWEKEVVPLLTSMYKGADGKWWPTHRWQLFPGKPYGFSYERA
jgi:hypothetical protein